MKIGDAIPEFELLNQNGETFYSNQIKNQPAVIYFYPMDETRGCTAQACAFRDAYEEFKDLGVEVIGISSDSVEKHQKFESNHNLPFILLSDEGKNVRKQFGVKGNLLGLVPGRETFVFGKNGRLIHTFRSQTKWNKHIEEALSCLKSEISR